MQQRWMRVYMLSLLLAGCGTSDLLEIDPSVATGLPPVMHRIDPATAHAGDVITVFGFGYSVAAAQNVLLAGGLATAASTYSILATPATDELEALTFTLPTALAPGDYPLTLLVHDVQSNATVTLTITP